MVEPGHTYLDEIVGRCQRRLDEARARVPLGKLQQEAEQRSDHRNFVSTLSGIALRIIAELKRASPSRGLLRRDYRRHKLARAYESAGASALSVLTEEHFFLGSLDDLRRGPEVVGPAVLPKDYVPLGYHGLYAGVNGVEALLPLCRLLPGQESP